MDFNKTVIRDKKEHYIRVKESNQQENVTFVSIFAPNRGALKYINQIVTPKGIDGNTVIVRNFNTPLTSMDRSSWEKNE